MPTLKMINMMRCCISIGIILILAFTGCKTPIDTYKETATPGQCTLRKLKAIVIDEVELRQANLNDVLELIQKRAGECEPAGKDGRLIVLGHCPTNPPAEVKVNVDPFSVSGQKTNDAGITFSARSISLHDLVDSVCRIAGYEWSIDDKKGTMIFREKGNIKLGKPERHRSA